MTIEFDQHDEIVFLLPLVGMSYGECDKELCDADHWRISIGLFIWSMHLIF